MNGNILCHLKLEFFLAIPASNELKIETNNSATQRLRMVFSHAIDILG